MSSKSTESGKQPKMIPTTACSRQAMLLSIALFSLACCGSLHAQVLGDPVDVSQDFKRWRTFTTSAGSLKNFDTATAWNSSMESIPSQRLSLSIRSMSASRADTHLNFLARNTIRILHCPSRFHLSAAHRPLRLSTRAAHLTMARR